MSDPQKMTVVCRIALSLPFAAVAIAAGALMWRAHLRADGPSPFTLTERFHLVWIAGACYGIGISSWIRAAYRFIRYGITP